MSVDSIVDEVRTAREAYAARFAFDVQAMVRDLQRLEQREGRVVLPPPDQTPKIDLAPRQPELQVLPS